MTLVSSGEISLGGSTTTRSVDLELGRSATATISLGESAVRTLFNVASGAISLSNGYGKSAGGDHGSISVPVGTGDGSYTHTFTDNATVTIGFITGGGGGGSSWDFQVDGDVGTNGEIYCGSTLLAIARGGNPGDSYNASRGQDGIASNYLLSGSPVLTYEPNTGGLSSDQMADGGDGAKITGGTYAFTTGQVMTINLGPGGAPGGPYDTEGVWGGCYVSW